MTINPQRARMLTHYGLDRVYVRGEGAWLTDEQGRRVLDLTSQYGALPFGHNPPEMWRALEKFRAAQRPALVQPSGRPVHAQALAERLAALAPIREDTKGAPVVVFTSSGSEAVDVAVRMARLATGRPDVAACTGAYHGNTRAARWLSDTSHHYDEEYSAKRHNIRIEFNNIPQTRATFEAHGETLGAVIVEPVQGEGGIWAADVAWLEALRGLCDAHGALLIFDEIQTGLGRWGHLFAAASMGVEGDMVLISKALGGGLVPLGACIAARRLHTDVFAYSHGSTFANNNLTCAVGLAAVDALTDDLLDEVQARGARMIAALEALGVAHPGVINDVRGAGGLIGLELARIEPSSSYFMHLAWHQGAWPALLSSYLLNVHGVRVIPCRSEPGTLRIQPPLNLDAAAERLALDALAELVQVVAYQDWARLMSGVAPSLPLPAVGSRAADRRALARPVRASRASRSAPRRGRFAFIIHHTCPADVVGATPAFGDLGPVARNNLYHWIAGCRDASSGRPAHAPVCYMEAVCGAGDAWVDGYLIALPHTPESMFTMDYDALVADIRAAVHYARCALGADVVGLGAFTSIMTANGALVDDGGGALTTGSAYTVATAIEGLQLAAGGRRLRTVLLCGLGVVGQAASVLAGDLAANLILAGNPRKVERERAKVATLSRAIYARALTRLRAGERGGMADAIAACLRQRNQEPADIDVDGVNALFRACGAPSPVRFVPDANLALGEADALITATSAAGPTIDIAKLRPGAVVCDVAKPPDLCASVKALRPDVFVFDGALAQYPEPITFGANIGYPDGVNLACLTETVLLALEGAKEGAFGVGRGSIIDEVEAISEAARRHGFRVARLRAAGQIITATPRTRDAG